MLHIRLKEELERLGLKPAAAAKAAGEPDSQGLRDVLGGRKRLSADLLSMLATTGVDVLYVLTGQRGLATPITSDEQVLLDGYRALDVATRRRMLAFMLSGAEQGQGEKAGAATITVTANGHGAQAAGKKIVNARTK